MANSMVDQDFEAFLLASAAITGFERADLVATGCAGDYWEIVKSEAPPMGLAAFLAGRESPLDAAVIELWYLGVWRGLMGTENRVVSARAYREGLVWRAIGLPPKGAKPGGYASWAMPPTREE
ncbi:MAG: hypothetical protein WAS73_12120 [Defluviicoccus sp.]